MIRDSDLTCHEIPIETLPLRSLSDPDSAQLGGDTSSGISTAQFIDAHGWPGSHGHLNNHIRAGQE